MANRGTKHVGSIKPHKEDFDSHFADFASFYVPTSCGKRRKMTGSSLTRVLKSPHKIVRTRSRISPRKHIMPAIPLEKDFVKKRVVTSDSEQARKTIDVKVQEKKKSKDEEGNLTTMTEIEEEKDDDFNDNFIITPPSNSDMLDQTVIVVRDSQESSEGETSILRSKLSEESKKFEVEVEKKKDSVVYLEDKMLAEKKKQELVQNRNETRRIFIKQDLQVLRQKLKRKENDLRSKESPTVEESESEEDVRENTSETTNASKKANENTSDNTENMTKCKAAGAEPPPGRRCVLKVRDKTRLAVESLFLSGGPRSEVKISLITMRNSSDLHEVLSGGLATLSSAVSQGLPSVGGELSEMLSLTEGLHLFMSGDEILLITQTCARVLESINQSGDTTSLSTVLSLLLLAWTQGMEVSEELCSAVISSIYDLVSLKDVSSVINPRLVSQVFRLLSVVTSHPQHFAALCQGGGEDTDCPVHMISFLTHYCSRKEVACQALTSWLLLSQRMSPCPAWIDNSCRKCTHEVIRNLVLMVESQVLRVVVDLHGIRPLLEPCVVVLKRFQDQLGVKTWRGMFEIAATICVKYVWSVKQMSGMALDSQIINKLNELEI